MDVEGVVLPGCRPGLGQHRLELRQAIAGQLIDDASPAATGAGSAAERSGLALGRAVLGDPAAGDQPTQTGVKGAVGQHPERAQDSVESLAQLIAMQRRLCLLYTS